MIGKFLPFKTPLGGSFVDMREDSQFSPSMLLDAVGGHGLTIGLVVDLTKTDRLSLFPLRNETIFSSAGSMTKQTLCLEELATISSNVKG